ncbi:LAGLIDADG family homing endonuclease [Candidatus Micrarchaeota archaeon]|nr:LAGLIDADG family homing endonuclease [Candidatus Micrarchaeota archaeon]MBI5176901.1 LAGLIDADG family homing endonuclease [Candidatus Micrarchaeota archaeon]
MARSIAIGRMKYLRYYLLGFSDGEGCFCVSLKKEPTTRFGFALDPMFHVTQHRTHADVLELFKRAFTCGRVMEKPGQPDTMQFMVDNRRQLVEKVIPFFDKYKPIVKSGDYLLFREIVLGLEAKKHSTLKGLEELTRLAFQMNMNGKQRRYSLEQVLEAIQARKADASETTSRTPENQTAKI